MACDRAMLNVSKWGRVGTLLLMAALCGCTREIPRSAEAETASARPATTTASSTPSATGTRAEITIPGRDAEDGQWIRPAKDYASTRFSGLDQITTANAASLKLAWSFSTGVLRGQEARWKWLATGQC